jgi:hypothetical protein
MMTIILISTGIYFAVLALIHLASRSHRQAAGLTLALERLGVTIVAPLNDASSAP